MAQSPVPEQSPEIFSDMSVKIRDLEDKQNLIKDRLLLMGENFISQKQSLDEEIMELKLRISNLEEELKRLRLMMNSIIENTNNFARKTELDILKKQFQMFEPLELARMVDVKKMIAEAINLRKGQA